MRRIRLEELSSEALQKATAEGDVVVVEVDDLSYLLMPFEKESEEGGPSYNITDPEEITAIEDALDDTDNPAYSTDEALQYLREKRKAYGND